MDTTNDCLVAVQGNIIVLLRPMYKMPKDQALRLAAWLVALAEENGEFAALLDAVKNT